MGDRWEGQSCQKTLFHNLLLKKVPNSNLSFLGGIRIYDGCKILRFFLPLSLCCSHATHLLWGCPCHQCEHHMCIPLMYFLRRNDAPMHSFTQLLHGCTFLPTGKRLISADNCSFPDFIPGDFRNSLLRPLTLFSETERGNEY